MAEQTPPPIKNYITPEGLKAIEDELTFLIKVDRPEVVRVVSWAASNGDRSENGDYIYGKKRLRQIDSRIRHLTKRMDAAVVVDPSTQQGLQKIYFGAWITLYDVKKETEQQLRIVGQDELDPKKGYISWVSPMAKALMGKQEGDTIVLETPAGHAEFEILSIEYHAPSQT